jgi:hypothetical protein
MRRAVALVASLIVAASALAQEVRTTVSTQAAVNHVGERARVCGRVASANFLGNKSLVIALDYPSPGQMFSVLIPSVDRPKFNAPELNLLDKRVCAVGTITLDKGRAQMVVTDPKLLTPQ